MKEFWQVLEENLRELKKGNPMYIEVNGEVVFEGTIADIKKCMSKENWASLMHLKVKEHDYISIFGCYVYRLVKPIPSEIENIIEGENENGK